MFVEYLNCNNGFDNLARVVRERTSPPCKTVTFDLTHMQFESFISEFPLFYVYKVCDYFILYSFSKQLQSLTICVFKKLKMAMFYHLLLLPWQSVSKATVQGCLASLLTNYEILKNVGDYPWPPNFDNYRELIFV